MRSFAAFVAHALFQAMRLGRYLGRHAVLLAVVGVMQVATVWAMRGGQLGANGTFITANGTTANDWQVAGPAGPGLYEGDAGGIIVELEGGATQIVDFGDTPSTVTVQPSVSLVGSGNLTWATSAANLVSLTTDGGTATIDGKTLSLGAAQATTINIGTNSGAVTAPTINIGAQGGSPNQTIRLGRTEGSSGSPIITLESNSETPSALFSVYSVAGSTTAPLLTLGPNFEPGTGTGGITYPCGTGGTQTINPVSYGLTVTTGTLSSNCIIDFGANNPTGLFYVDLSGATPGATFGIQFKNGSAASSVFTSSLVPSGVTLATVWTHGANTLAVSY